MILTNDTSWPVYTPAPINPNHTLNWGRVLWLLAVPPLDGGSTYWDLCGVYPGTLSGMTNAANNGWRPPVRSNGFSTLQFDGTAAQVTTPYAGLSGATQFTMAAWGRRTAASTIGLILQAGNSATAFVSIQQLSNGNYAFVVGNNTTGISQTAGNDAVWHRIMLVYDGTQASNANRFASYVDGKLSGAGAPSAVPTSIPTLATPFAIGRDINDNRWASGYADDIAIWNRPLTAREAFADYELSLLGYPGVLNRWRPSTLFVSFATSTSAGMAVTAGSDTIVASGKLTTPGRVIGAESHDALAAHGTFNTPASLNRTESHDTLAGAGAFNTPGSLSKTAASDTLAASSVFTTVGSLSKTGGNDTLAAAAKFATTGSLAKTEGHDNLAGAAIGGSNSSSGSLSATSGSDVLVAFASLAVFGSMVATSNSDVFSGTTIVPVFEGSIDPFAATLVDVVVPDPQAALFDCFAASLISP